MTLLKTWSWDWQITAHGPNPTHHVFLSIKFYWNIATLMCLYIVCGCFCTTAIVLNSYNRDYVATKHKIFIIWCFKALLSPHFRIAGNAIPIIPQMNSSIWPLAKTKWILKNDNKLPQTQSINSPNSSCYVRCTVLVRANKHGLRCMVWKEKLKQFAFTGNGKQYKFIVLFQG